MGVEMDMRDYFASKIATAMYSEMVGEDNMDWDFESIASSAYAFADAMMRERTKRPSKQCTVEEAFGL